MRGVTITVRVSEQLKEEIQKYGLNLSEVVRRSLEEEVKRRRFRELEKVADALGELLAKMPEERIVESISETRRSR